MSELPNNESYVMQGGPDIILVQSQSVEVIRIAPDGALFWRGREVETDSDFRRAMLDLAKHLMGKP